MTDDPYAAWDEPVHMTFDEPMGYDQAVAHGQKKPGAARAGKKRGKKAAGDDDKSKKVAIPRLPERERPLSDSEVRRGVSNRAKSAVNLKLAGASYQDIAETLEFNNATEARREVERALAATHTPDDWETLRLVAGARAEALFARSLAMASADYLVDDEGERIPNTDKLRWHQQAAADLMNHATITGAKAPTKLEISPDEAKMETLVAELLARSGQEDILDAEVLELEALPEPPPAEEWEGDDEP